MKPLEMLAAVLPGNELDRRKRPAGWDTLPELPKSFWEASGNTWAVYNVVGKRLSNATRASLSAAKAIGLEPVLVASDPASLRAVATVYVAERPHFICDVAGTPHLVPPLPATPAAIRQLKKSSTRVPLHLLKDVVETNSLPPYLQKQVRQLLRTYRTIAVKRNNNDDAEHAALTAFGTWMLRKIGLKKAEFDVPTVIRRLELGGWGGNRDHFFHSFQNFFFGLYALAHVTSSFVDACAHEACLHWNVDPFHVWFLTALWHDVGYGTASFEGVIDDLWGPEVGDDVDSYVRSHFLNHASVKDALRVIASLMARLLTHTAAVSSWMPPSDSSHLTPGEKRLVEAMKDDVSESGHGAAGALRLYTDLMPRVDRMKKAGRDQVRQTILLACASMPFHDWRFRSCVRNQYGACAIPVCAMPFAALLAFVDSIQDDRRNIAEITRELHFLKRLLVSKTRRVSATVQAEALTDGDVLWKIVEARDVLGSLVQDARKLTFAYPSWMAT